MSRAFAEATATIDAPAAAIYAVLADYRHSHPQILPRPPFTYLHVEQGGTGEGTIIRFALRVLGRERTYHQIVREPEPGRVLIEQDVDGDQSTSFTVDPIDANRSRVTIRTEWPARAGLLGKIEQAMARRLLQPIYIKELQQLTEYVQQQSRTSDPQPTHVASEEIR